MSQTYEDFLLSFLHSGNDELAAALLRNNPQLAEKRDRVDAYLVLAVRKDCPESLTVLAEMGGDINQRVDGRTLNAIAPRGDRAVKRLLRSMKMATDLGAAMPADEQPATAPTVSMTL